MHGDASLWESFPRVLERRAGTRRYVGAFRAPFQDLRLTPPQEHALRACSLLAIPPPPPGQEALPGGVPEDLSQDNLSTWADTVQDVAAGMIAPQPETSQTIFPQVVEVLTLLESVSWWHFVASVTCRDPPADALGVVAPPQLHPLLDCRGVTLPIQHSAPTRHRLGEAPDWRFHMDLQPWQAAPFGICLLQISRGSLEPLLPSANHAPLLGGPLIWKANSWPSGME